MYPEEVQVRDHERPGVLQSSGPRRMERFGVDRGHVRCRLAATKLVEAGGLQTMLAEDAHVAECDVVMLRMIYGFGRSG